MSASASMKRNRFISSARPCIKPSERKQKEKQVPLFAEMADARSAGPAR